MGNHTSRLSTMSMHSPLGLPQKANHPLQYQQQNISPNIKQAQVSQRPMSQQIESVPTTRSTSPVASVLDKQSPHIQFMHTKKKRGRPKKLIFDPLTNRYIDSSHPSFKQLNKLLKCALPNEDDPNVRVAGSAKHEDHPRNLRLLEDEAVQELILKKDRRGRPRKFPIEETGLTIKGIRVNGVIKHRKRKSHSEALDGKSVKRERGRPKKILKTTDDIVKSSLDMMKSHESGNVNMGPQSSDESHHITSVKKA